MFLARLPVVYVFLGLFILRGDVLVLVVLAGRLVLTAGLLGRGCGCRRVRKAFSGFCPRHSGLFFWCSFGFGPFCGRACRGLCVCVFWFVDSGELLEGLVLMVGSGGARGALYRVGYGLGVMRRSDCGIS